MEMKIVCILLAAYALLAAVLYLRLELASRADDEYRDGTRAVAMARGYAK
jgi:hypothetical protein